jgi:hypothetical protein
MADMRIDYGKLVDEAMHVIVYRVLQLVEKSGLPGDHHFFISFITQHPGVKISKQLLSRYPREMTIVLQYQFQNLHVSREGFSVSLSFSGNKEEIYVPFAAITTFADPSEQFGLQFQEVMYQYGDVEIDVMEDDANKKRIDKKNNHQGENNTSSANTKKASSAPASVKKVEDNISNVVSLDEFRKR